MREPQRAIQLQTSFGAEDICLGRFKDHRQLDYVLGEVFLSLPFLCIFNLEFKSLFLTFLLA